MKNVNQYKLVAHVEGMSELERKVLDMVNTHNTNTFQLEIGDRFYYLGVELERVL